MFKIRSADETIGLLSLQVYDKYKKSVEGEAVSDASNAPLRCRAELPGTRFSPNLRWAKKMAELTSTSGQPGV
jgi:hypothetical protein